MRTSCTRGDRLGGSPGMRMEVLNPPKSNRNPSFFRNEQSVVLLAEYGEMTFLFTGDSDARSESAMLANSRSGSLASEILKIPHHGSSGGTTQAFLNAVRPNIALLSVGARNSYGHPSPAVVDRLVRSGCRIFPTSSRGTVELSTDGRRLWIRTARTP